MAVIITNMDMPQRCGMCRFATALDCTANGKFIKDHKTIAAHCPLKSADEMIAEINDKISIYSVWELNGIMNGLKEALEIIHKYTKEQNND